METLDIDVSELAKEDKEKINMYRLRKDIELSYAIFYILLIMPVVAFMLLIPAMIWPPIAILSMLILVGDAVFVILFFAYTFIAYVIDTFFEKV